jgi:hypothetical protein
VTGVGLGDGPKWWDEFEWVRLADLPPAALEPPAPAARASADAALAGSELAAALREQVEEARVWSGRGARLLLVDLDNLRAGPARWQARMAVVVALAREADHVVLAGQVGAVARATPHLGEFAGLAQAVPDGSDLADHALLEGARAYAAALAGVSGQVVVASNDGIFAELAEQGWDLTVLSPGHEALSDRLRDAARRTVDLVDAERAATRRWRSRALRAAALSPARRGAAARAAGRGGSSRGTTRRRARAPRG